MDTVKIFRTSVVLLLSGSLLTACGIFGSQATRVINLSKSKLPDSKLAIVNSIQQPRLNLQSAPDIEETLTLYPAKVTTFGNHRYKLDPGKQALKIRWDKAMVGTETIMTDMGMVDEKGKYIPMPFPTDVPTYLPMGDFTYTIELVLKPNYIYQLETIFEQEKQSKGDGSPKRVCVEGSLQNKDKNLLKWARAGCTSR